MNYITNEYQEICTNPFILERFLSLNKIRICKNSEFTLCHYKPPTGGFNRKKLDCMNGYPANTMTLSYHT